MSAILQCWWMYKKLEIRVVLCTVHLRVCIVRVPSRCSTSCSDHFTVTPFRAKCSEIAHQPSALHFLPCGIYSVIRCAVGSVASKFSTLLGANDLTSLPVRHVNLLDRLQRDDNPADDHARCERFLTLDRFFISSCFDVYTVHE